MTGQAPLALAGYNPDVLTCIANLSNDEVFTPPELANRMLDTLELAWAEANEGASIWADPTVTFLDPFTKSGVFLREIVSRLTVGLAERMPDLQERVDHILTKQVFGIAITQLTALLARRSVYCSKFANGPHSIARSFDTADGNIWFERTEHTWIERKRERRVDPLTGEEALVQIVGTGRCAFCDASEAEYGREDDLETHAYAFIHTDDIKARIGELFGADMQFDVIIGNPPYQLGSNGGTRDVPIYQHFVEQAMALEPRLLTMVIPSRWMAAGLGLRDFRESMLHDRRLRALTDYPVAKDVFTGVEVKGGVCTFLWDADYDGLCEVTTVRGKEVTGPVARDLGEYDVFVRDARAVDILRKVLSANEVSVNTILSADKEFGWTSNFDGFHARQQPGDVPLYYVRKAKRDIGFIARAEVSKSAALIDTWKVLVPKAGSGGGAVPDYVLGRPQIAPSPSVCTQSFLFFHVGTESEAVSVASYYATRFFRFLVSLRKITQDATKATYRWVPLQSWDRTWTDAELYAKYGLTAAEVAFIESQVTEVSWAGDFDV
ncbi:Eco57I restriction-modification methylase domain-containing protein [Gryllotalpicola kribbensis]|uniref:site-specific DNA-methyltransferase (adenine-specific) n=1 Tax=Gryllotalpicola kribbensis TaxID=993084 RepID=A0ABP8AF34_9MICO